MKLKYFTEEAYNYLYDNMENNRELYKKDSVWLKDFFKGKEYAIETGIEYPEFQLINTGNKTEDDFENTKIVFNALGKILTPHQACNKYMWSYLAHDRYWNYTKQRWAVESGASIKTRYFCGDSRNSLSLNSLSRLWWYGYLTYDDQNPKDPYHLTHLMTDNTDLCQNLVQHKYSMNKTIALGFLEGVKKFMNEGGDFSEEKERSVIKYINRYGAVTSLDILTRKEIKQVTYEYLDHLQGN